MSKFRLNSFVSTATVADYVGERVTNGSRDVRITSRVEHDILGPLHRHSLVDVPIPFRIFLAQ